MDCRRGCACARARPWQDDTIGDGGGAPVPSHSLHCRGRACSSDRPTMALWRSSCLRRRSRVRTLPTHAFLAGPASGPPTKALGSGSLLCPRRPFSFREWSAALPLRLAVRLTKSTMLLVSRIQAESASEPQVYCSIDAQYMAREAHVQLLGNAWTGNCSSTREIRAEHPLLLVEPPVCCVHSQWASSRSLTSSPTPTPAWIRPGHAFCRRDDPCALSHHPLSSRHEDPARPRPCMRIPFPSLTCMGNNTSLAPSTGGVNGGGSQFTPTPPSPPLSSFPTPSL